MKKDEEQIEQVQLTHIVVLKSHPHYVLAHNEKTAIEICEQYSDISIGIGVAPGGISMKSIQIHTFLTDIKMKEIPQYILSEDGNTLSEMPTTSNDDLDEEELEILGIKIGEEDE